MTRHLPKSFGILFIFISRSAFAQHEFFHEIVLEKSFISRDTWAINAEFNFKYLYNEPAWRRWGVSIAGVRKISRLNITGGLNGYYTFNRTITNFFEVRPWAALQFNLPLFAHITLRQRLRYEWRFFFTEDNSSSREDYGRLRYQIGIDIPIPEGEESSWKIRPYFEWFYIRNPASFERFSNERDFGILVFKRFENEHEISFGVQSEVYYDLNAQREFGYLFMFSYSL